MESGLEKHKANEISPLKKGVDTFWEKQGHDHILHIGTMRKAIVVSGYCNGIGGVLTSSVSYYSISPRSYFPFSDSDYNKRFENPEECKDYAVSKIRDWVQSILCPIVDVNKI